MAANPNTVGMITFSIGLFLSKQALLSEPGPAVCAAGAIPCDHEEQVGATL